MRSTAIVLVLFLYQINPILLQSIDGPTAACGSDCHSYDILGGAGGPYIWNVTNGVYSNNQGSSIQICWEEDGVGNISVIDNSAVPGSNQYLLTVAITKSLDPEIFFPLFPTCISSDTIVGTDGNQEAPPILCKTACPGSVATYITEDIPDLTNSWIVDGGSVTSSTSNSVTVEWEDVGFGTISLFQDQDSTCSDSIKYCIEILEPVDLAIIAMNGNATSASLCVGQTLYLEAESTNAISYDWSTTDGQAFVGTQVAITFPTAGNYQVALTGVTDCSCSDTIYYEVMVESTPGPEITCIGLTCVGEEQTYYAGELCTSYDWSISSEGTIVDGGGTGDDYITVVWNSGPEGLVSLNTSGCDTPTCQEATEVSIPVMDGNAYISGPDLVCWDDVTKFSAPYYQGANYVWSITGNGTIIGGYNTNEIIIEWQDQNWQPDTSLIELFIDNCYLECSAYASKKIDIKKRFIVSGDPIVCENQNAFFSAAAGYDFATADWEVHDPQGLLIASIPNEDWLSYSFVNGPGTYRISATETSGDYCNLESTVFIEVISTPDPPISIDGPSMICLNKAYTYSVNNVRSDYAAQWIIRDGNMFKSFEGDIISYEWTSGGPYSVEVLFIDERTGCRSEYLVLPVTPINASALIGNNNVCIDDLAFYEVVGAQGKTLSWTITPANAGSMLSLPDGKAEVVWNIAGTHQLETVYCGNVLNMNVQVNVNTIPSLVYPTGICEGSLGTLTAGIIVGETLVARDENNDIVGTGSSFNISSGYYTLEFTNLDGCTVKESIYIESYPPPEILISALGPTAYCNQLPNIDLYALNTNEGYTYQWFRNNVPVGTDTDIFTTNQIGTYVVEVTDVNGCTAISNELELKTGVCIGIPAECVVTGSIDFGINPGMYCNTFDFTNNSIGYVPGSLIYNFGDPESGVDNTSTNENPMHVYSQAGFYFVVLIGALPNTMPPPDICYGGVGKLLTVPVASNFDFTPACANDVTSFRELATFLPTYSISSYEWDFGDPVSGVNNISSKQNPDHVFSSAGKYLVTLTITANTGCQARIAKEIIVHPSPVVDFELPTTQCVARGLKFSTLDTGNLVKLEWDFGDPASGAANNSNSPDAVHEYTTAGNYTVSLTAENIYGCITTVSKNLQTSTTNLSGQITADKALPVCEGEEIILTAPLGGISYVWSTGETTPSITVSAAGSYGVTLTSMDVCDYTPDEFVVSLISRPSTSIRGFIVDNFSVSQEAFFDEIEICIGENIVLNANFISSTSYLWSNGETGNFLNQTNFSGLPVGEYDYTVEMTDNLSGCKFLSDPFKVIIRPLPDAPQVQASENNPCEGTPVTFTITNPQPGAFYTWNNGKSGLSITESTPGIYFASVLSPYGCSARSNARTISPTPNADVLVSGCRQACFPDTLCLPNQSIASYQWIKDGTNIPAPEGTIRDYIVTEPGDYQVILTSFSGCIDSSGVLNLEPEPADQSVEGKIFIDNNGNGVYEMGDELIHGVPVYLYSAAVIVGSTTSDVNGAYVFDPIIDTDLSVQIDTAGLGLDLMSSNLLLPLDFSSCIEDKVLDFPLYRDCVASYGTVNVMGCPGEMIDYEGRMITVGQTVEIMYTNVAGCDSLLEVITSNFLPPLLELATVPTCQSEDNGGLDITIISGTNLSFALDGSTAYSPDLIYTSLSAGPHTLSVIDNNGCYTDYNFVINNSMTVPVVLNTSASCAGSNSGSVEIMAASTSMLSYSIDGINFSSNNIFSNLLVADYDVYVMNEDGCITTYSATIEEANEPEIFLIATGTCSTGTGGTVTAENMSAEDLMYSIDGSNFVTTNVFTGLSVGVFDVFYMSNNGCVFASSVIVPEEPVPSISLASTPSCPDSPTGNILVTNNSTESLSYSLDGISYQSELSFGDLQAGEYTVSVLGSQGCVFTFDTEIEEGSSLEVETNDPVIDCSTDQVALIPTVIQQNGAINYSWSNGSGNAEIVINESGTYFVEISDNCTTDFYQWEVELAEVDENVYVYRPNVFSPNNDGHNDCFQIFPDPALEVLRFEMYIFDRWGNKVYESFDLEKCWDGNFQNEEGEIGVYTWLMISDISVCNERKSVKRSGDITLVR